MRRAALALLAATLVFPAPAVAAWPRKHTRGFVPAPPTTRQLEALGETREALVQSRVPLGVVGGSPVSSALEVWRIPGRLVADLVRRGVVIQAEPVRSVAPLATRPLSDSLLADEWWRAAVGADAAPAGAGVPVTVIDTGLDLTHPEFAGRPNTLVLNRQSLVDTTSDFHGTAVGSLVGAPANAVGIVGVYPSAVLRTWDARTLTNVDVVKGLDVASRTRGVINLSLGSTMHDRLIEAATLLAFGRGSLIVAASGNSFAEGNPLTYPASLSHVLTVAATDATGQAASFSSGSQAVDLAAPGEAIPVAVPRRVVDSGYAAASGTSFAAPIVSGAAAWVWTARPELDNTQLFDVMRSSARDTGPAGFDPRTGFGVLDIPAALARPALAPDAKEPNDDVFEVKPRGLFRRGIAPLTHARHGRATTAGRLDFAEDPEDVYRVWVPAHGRVTVTVSASANVDLELWGPNTRTVAERGAAQRRDLLEASANAGTASDTVAVRNPGRRGRFVYADVFLGRDARSAAYSLDVTTASGR